MKVLYSWYFLSEQELNKQLPEGFYTIEADKFVVGTSKKGVIDHILDVQKELLNDLRKL